MAKDFDYELIIVGGGPAALSAAVYGSRGGLKTAFIEKDAPGGKVVNQSKIENWLGDEIVEGPDLAIRMYNHGIKFGAEHIFGEVTKIETNGDYDHVVTYKNPEGEFKKSAKSIIIASGMVNREPLDIPNIRNYYHKGVSFCSICDGPIFGYQPSVVIGGGNSAVEEGAYLANVASHVHFVVRDAKFNAEQSLVEELLKRKNVTIHYESRITEVAGENKLEQVTIETKDGKTTTVSVASIFPYIGFLPAANFAKDLGILEPNGFIKTDELMQTKIKGIYAAGDIRLKDVRQIVTASSDGAIAAKDAAQKVK
ncbi:thioredoxin reductase (NADPH) [Mycoplasma testudineum]|uniref:Thioredoxin reductase (NADPH) n=1 Tax=Mycoplasma testudineum TaxID=244584 RepID=A0A4R6IFA4_9MOLU|nr:FAD-dependent oxidoreductase [Mycoplasma testudineum]OYD26866.1 thioredoxin reductase [Mycoplasma testudineum]TDO20401.1 thioredoxin reductase (NADPH) [Mycoplasma testudineum]